MKLLVFDTCLDKMYVTLSENDKILTSKIVENHDNKYHSAFLISTIKEILHKNDISPNDLDAVGTNIGPGSFTGIRACTTVARIMGQQLGISVAGISSLELLSNLSPEGYLSAVVLDARKNSGYFYIDNEIKGAVELEKIEEKLSEGHYYVITDNKLKSRFNGHSYESGEYQLGEVLAHLCYQKLQTNSCQWQDLKPLYIQPPPMG